MNGDIINLASEEKEPEQTVAAEGGEQEPNYPELHINDISDPALMQLPDHAVHEIHGTVVHRSTRTARNGKKKYSARIKIHSIKPVRHAKQHDHRKQMISHEGPPIRHVDAKEALGEAGFPP